MEENLLVERVAKDTSQIPEGTYCYKPIGWDGERYRVKPCPYWGRTEHGTVKCEFLDIESLTEAAGEREDELRKLAYAHYGSREKAWEAAGGNLLWDQVKECGINDDYI